MGMDNLVEELSIKQAQEDHKGCIIVNFSLPYYGNDLKSRRHQFKGQLLCNIEKTCIRACSVTPIQKRIGVKND
jgi:hypothetical protein